MSLSDHISILLSDVRPFHGRRVSSRNEGPGTIEEQLDSSYPLAFLSCYLIRVYLIRRCLDYSCGRTVPCCRVCIPHLQATTSISSSGPVSAFPFLCIVTTPNTVSNLDSELEDNSNFAFLVSVNSFRGWIPYRATNTCPLLLKNHHRT